MKKTLFTLLLFAGYLNAHAQRQADYVSKFDSKIESIILDNLTGNIVVKEANKISAFNPESNAVEWVITDEQIGKMGIGSKLKKADELMNDPNILKIFQSTDKLSFLNNTPFIQANVNSNDIIIDAISGKILFNSATTNYRVVLSQYVQGDDKFLFLATEGKEFKLILFDLKTGADKWETIVGNKESMLKTILAKKIAESFGSVKLIQKDEVITTSDAIYGTINNRLYKLDKETGKILWSAKEDVHRFYLSKDSKNVIVMRNAGNIMSSKRALNVLNTENGNPIFKEEIITKTVSYIEDWGNKFLVAYSDGFNFFDYTTGKKIWKKDAKGDDIKQVIPVQNDYLYIADNEMSLIDSEGKQKWKDFVEISDDKADPVYFLNKIDGDKVFYLTGTYGNMVDYNTGKKVWRGNIKFDPKLPLLYAYDDETKSFLVYNDEKLYKFDPSAKDKPEAFAKVKVRNDKTLSSLALFDWGVSLTGEYEVIGIGKDGVTKFQKTYKEPGEAARRLMKSAGVLAQSVKELQSGLQNSASEAKFVQKDEKGKIISESYVFNESTRNALKKEAAKNAEIANTINKNITKNFGSRFKALKQNSDFAFIFARGEADQSNYLVKVRKSDGVEVDKVAIDNTKPLYEIDNVNDNLYYVYQNELRVFSKK